MNFSTFQYQSHEQWLQYLTIDGSNEKIILKTFFLQNFIVSVEYGENQNLVPLEQVLEVESVFDTYLMAYLMPISIFSSMQII